MSKSLNIGLVGSGFMGQAHADAYRRARILYRDLASKPEIDAIADQNAALAEEARARFGFENAYGDWRQLVEDPKIDLVDITTPNFLHVEVALAALEAGKHVYCEKPMAVTVEGARRMAAAAKKSGVKTMVAFNNIKNPAALLAKQIIERGEIGQPVRFRGTFDQGFFNDPSCLGPGAVRENWPARGRWGTSERILFPLLSSWSVISQRSLRKVRPSSRSVRFPNLMLVIAARSRNPQRSEWWRTMTKSSL